MKKIALFLSAAMTLTLLVAPAAAAGTSASVERKEAPQVVAVQDKAGQQVAGLIHDAEGNEVSGVPAGDLTVTPVSKADQASETISKALSQAYDQIQAANSLADLAPALEQVLPDYDKDVKVADLVVRDLFDVSLSGDYLAEAGNTITIRFDLKLNPNELLLVLHNYSGSDWEVIAKDRVVRNADGSVDVTFDSLSPVAFVVDGASVTVDPNAPASPQTGDNSVETAMVLLGVAVVAGAFLARKKYMAG